MYVYICVYVCVYVYIYAYMCIYVYAYVYMCINVYIYVEFYDDSTIEVHPGWVRLLQSATTGI